MVRILTAIEVNPYGIFKDSQHAKVFNKEVGDLLRLYAFRTTLSMQQLIEEFYKPGEYFHYLEQCCGKGNVVLEVSEPSMLVVQAIVGPIEKREYMSQLTKLRERYTTPDLKFCTVQSLLNFKEIERIALSSHKAVFVQHFGEVTKRNLEPFKELYYKKCTESLPEYFKKTSGGI